MYISIQLVYIYIYNIELCLYYNPGKVSVVVITKCIVSHSPNPLIPHGNPAVINLNSLRSLRAASFIVTHLYLKQKNAARASSI